MVTLTVDEAIILDTCIAESDGYHALLLVLGTAIGAGEDARLSLTEDELWKLRDMIDPHEAAGKKTGVSVRVVLYDAIQRLHDLSLALMLSDIAVPKPKNVQLIRLEEIEDADRSTPEADEGSPEDTSKA